MAANYGRAIVNRVADKLANMRVEKKDHTVSLVTDRDENYWERVVSFKFLTVPKQKRVIIKFYWVLIYNFLKLYDHFQKKKNTQRIFASYSTSHRCCANHGVTYAQSYRRIDLCPVLSTHSIHNCWVLLQCRQARELFSALYSNVLHNLTNYMQFRQK